MDISDDRDIHVTSDERATTWEELYVPSTHSQADPNRAPTEIAPFHKNQMDHGVRDPDCDQRKRALGPLYHHKIKGNRHLPVLG